MKLEGQARVLVLASWYPNSANTLSGIFIQEQVRALALAGTAVAVFYPFDASVPKGELLKRDEGGYMVYRANTLQAGPNRYLARLMSYVRGLRFLARLESEFRPDLIHVQVGYPGAALAYLFTRRTRLPYMITEHMSTLGKYAVKWRRLLKPAFEQAALVLPVSPSLGAQIQGFGWDVKLDYLPNVVDTARFVPKGSATRDYCSILFVGSMDDTEVKGVQYLLPAFKEALQEHGLPPLHLYLAGGGVMLPHYRQRAEELGISACCTFLGQVENSRLPEVMNSCDFLVLSSLRETFGCVLIEAMACGKPVLATACGGPESFVTPEAGMLVKPGSSEELARGLVSMLRAYNQYDPGRIRKYAEERFSPAAIAGRLQELYSRIVTGEKV